MPLNLFYTMVQKSQKWPKTQIKGGSCLNRVRTTDRLRPAGSDPGADRQKILFLKVGVSLSGFAPSVAHGKLSVRGRCVQATKNKAESCSLLDAIGRRSCGRPRGWGKYSELALPRTGNFLASLRMFLKLGKTRQRSSKRMFLSRTSRGRIHAHEVCRSLLQIGSVHSICAADRAMRTVCRRKLALRKSIYSSEAFISEGSLKERQQQLKIGFC